MNEQELYVRVGELATRVGYPMPAIERTTDPKVPWVHLKEGTVGPTMVLNCHTEELPPQVVDFLVAQEFVQARAGAFRYRKRLQLVGWATGIAVWAPLLLATDLSYWTTLAIALPLGYLLQYVIVVGWRRGFLWRSDRLMVDVLGSDVVESALDWLADCQPWPKNLRWLWSGAVPPPMDRLRKLDLQTA